MLSTCCWPAGGEERVREVGVVGGGGGIGPLDAGAAGGVQLRPEGGTISLLGAILGVDLCLGLAGGGGGEGWADEDWRVVESGTSPPLSAASLSGRFFFLLFVLSMSNSVLLLLLFLLPLVWRQLQHPGGVGVGVVPSSRAGHQPQWLDAGVQHPSYPHHLPHD